MKKDCSNCAREKHSIPCYECLIGGAKTPVRWEEGEAYVPDTISLRAFQQVERRSQELGVPVPDLLGKIGVEEKQFKRWRKNKYGISAYYLEQMALDGYDVVYILTGERTANG